MSGDAQSDKQNVIVQNPWLETWRMYVKNKTAVFGLLLLIAIIVVTLFAPGLYGVNSYDIVWAPFGLPGENGFLLGTDYLGRDILAGIFYGGRATMAVGLSAACCAVFLGVFIGALAGFYGKWVDTFLMRVTEFFQVLPPLLFAMVLVALFSPSLVTISLAIGLVSWPSVARLTRGEFLKIKRLEYVVAAKALSASNRRIIWKIILPNCLPPLIVSATLNVGSAILFEAGLSFLGLGDPNVMSWGLMIGSNRDYIFQSWWAVTFPGLAIFLTVLSVSLIGDGLTDALNPKLREL